MSTSELGSLQRLIDEQPISRLQWIVFGVCMAMNALDGMDVLVISYAAPLLADAWSIPATALGAVFSAGLVGMTLGAMFIAPYADVIGRRTMILLAIVITGGGVSATAMADSLPMLITLRLISGAGIGAMLASVATLAAEYAPDRRRNLIVGIVLAGYPIGAVLFGLVAAEILPVFGWQSAFVAAGATTLLSLPLVWWLLPESLSFLADARPKRALERCNEILAAMGRVTLPALPPQPTTATRRSVSGLFEPPTRLATVFLWAAFFMCFAGLYFLTSWIPKLASSAGLPLELAIYAGAIFNLGAVFGIATSGVMSQRFGLRYTISGFLGLTGVVMLLFGFATGSAWTLVLFGLIGFLLQGGFVGLYVIAARLYPTVLRTTGVGWAIGAGRTGAIVGPFVGGLLVAAGFGIAANFRWFAIALLLAAVFTLRIRSDQVS
ncbi:MAG: MFS transporter [Pseudomonadota bacterium]